MIKSFQWLPEDLSIMDRWSRLEKIKVNLLHRLLSFSISAVTIKRRLTNGTRRFQGSSEAKDQLKTLAKEKGRVITTSVRLLRPLAKLCSKKWKDLETSQLEMLLQSILRLMFGLRNGKRPRGGLPSTLSLRGQMGGSGGGSLLN